MDDLLDFIATTGPLPAVPSARGGRKRASGAASVTVLRELNEADMDLILNPPEQRSTSPATKSLRHSHHALARMLAEGHKPHLCAAVTGYSSSRISILQADPAFAELVEYYRDQVADVFVDAQKRLADLGIDTVEELHERLNDAPEKFSNNQLLSMAEMAFDRSVAPSKRAVLGAAGANGAPVLPSIQINFIEAPQGTAAGSQASPPTIPGTVLADSQGE